MVNQLTCRVSQESSHKKGEIDMPSLDLIASRPADSRSDVRLLMPCRAVARERRSKAVTSAVTWTGSNLNFLPLAVDPESTNQRSRKQTISHVD